MEFEPMVQAMAVSSLCGVLADAPVSIFIAEELLLFVLLATPIRGGAFGRTGALEQRFKGDVSTSIVRRL